jgi:hypothetical protein
VLPHGRRYRGKTIEKKEKRRRKERKVGDNVAILLCCDRPSLLEEERSETLPSFPPRIREGTIGKKVADFITASSLPLEAAVS